MRKIRFFNYILAIIISILSGGGFIPCMAADGGPLALCLEDDKGKILFEKRVHNGDEFAIRFIHSVAKTPVTDYFIVKDGKIFLDKTIYHDFGAGLPHNPGKGQEMKTEHGEISITGFNREIPELALRVGRIAEHTLVLPDKDSMQSGPQKSQEIPLNTLAKAGSVILFRIQPGK